MQKYIWMKVSRDEYELPEVIGDSAEDLARKCGTTSNAIFTAINHAEHRGYRCQYKRVPVLKDEEEE